MTEREKRSYVNTGQDTETEMKLVKTETVSKAGPLSCLHRVAVVRPGPAVRLPVLWFYTCTPSQGVARIPGLGSYLVYGRRTQEMVAITTTVHRKEFQRQGLSPGSRT